MGVSRFSADTTQRSVAKGGTMWPGNNCLNYIAIGIDIIVLASKCKAGKMWRF